MRTHLGSRQRVVLVAMAWLSWLPLLGGCTDDEEPQTPTPQPPARTTESGAPRLVVEAEPMQVRVVRVGGALSSRERTRVQAGIARTLGRFVTTAYLDTDLRRGDVGTAFAVFTPAAARQAKRQADVTTGRVLAPELTQVVPTVRRVRTAVFAPDRGPAGATAYLTLVLVGARVRGGEVEQTVRGELFLTATNEGWRVFGFELTRSEGAVGSFVRSSR